ncbi:TIGR03086 family metal-binding protein [Nocardiopsis sp. RSe5-2]|uniref:TIGR03086 family metal-binding protein n=1 Tax=Nocardiopsis endophytica TaxID=3018445 RepID=A0ABT4TYJ8_9ACTN|nr:TIGR03086 family metal-binding protein [Nocardiopsis endophytica]MDA2809775.1 TIGR03086 family metal-binding protein [Nocardiopsis endophytica]
MIDLKPACSHLAALAGAIGDGEADLSTPCADYTVADLLDHLGVVARGFAALGRGGPGPGSEDAGGGGRGPTELGGLLAELGRAWDDPAAWQGRADAAGVGLPRQVWGRIALTEVVVHGWDLARATGRGFDPPEAAVRACLEHVADFVPKAPVPELWGPEVPVGPGAPLLDRVVAITGRDPGWTAP